MKAINERIKGLAEKVNSKYNLFTNEQLDSIQNMDHNLSIKMAMHLLDFILKQNVFLDYKNYFDMIAETIDKSYTTYFYPRTITEILKDRNFKYAIYGGSAIDVFKNNNEFNHKEMIVDVLDKYSALFIENLCGMGGEAYSCYDDGNLKPPIVQKFYDCDYVVTYSEGSKVGVRFMRYDKEHKLRSIRHKDSDNGAITLERIITPEEQELCFSKTSSGLSIQSLESIYVDKIKEYSEENFLELLEIASYIDYEKVKRIKLLPERKFEVIEKSDKNGLSKIS